MNDCKHCKYRIQKGKYCGICGLEREMDNDCGQFELDKITEIKVKIGDIVIRKDGLKGKVVNLFDDIPVVGFENNTSLWIKGELVKDFYLIGHTVLGNKATEEELKERIAEKEKEIQQAKKEKDQLRKQLWRIREEMVEDWRERKALRQLRKLNKENQSTEQHTED